MGWKCGPKVPCTLDQFIASTKPDELDVNGLKTQVATLFTKINGNDKKCYADLYNDGTENKKALVICFNGNEEFNKLKELFMIVNPLDLKKNGEALDPSTEQKFNLHFTDGLEAYTNKTITFKSDGLYDETKLLFRYEFLDAMDGKKCNVYHNLPIFPIKFLENQILFSKCLLKFKYNQIETYMASTDKNCEEATKYIALKMKNSCLNYINGEGNKYGNDLISRPFEGKWTGWAHYHKILDNGGEVIPDLFKVEILPELIKVYDSTISPKETIEHRFIEWNCNDMGECNVWEYMQFLKRTFQTMKLNDFHMALKKIKDVWKLQDINFCFVIDEKDSHIICPRDMSEEVNARKALAIAIDMNLYDARINLFLPFSNNKTFYITKVSDSNPYLKDYVIKVKEDKIYLNDNDKEGEVFLDYLSMKPINEIPCGLEFRHFSLPIAYHEVSPICCARYVTDENNYICIQNQAKCYIVLRKLIRTIRSNCLGVKKIKKTTNSTAEDPNFPISPVDPEKKSDTVKAWSGEVILNEIDNYKYKGEVAIKNGFLKISDNSVIISDSGIEIFNIDLLTLKFICLSEYVCLPEEYKRSQEIFLEKNYDRDWQESTFAKFWAANAAISQNDCMVITSEDAEKEVSQMILVCTASKHEGQNLRESITDIYNKKISKLKEGSSDLLKIPTAPDNSEFEAEIITSSADGQTISSSSSQTLLKIMGDSVIFKASGAVLVTYKELVDPKTLQLGITWDSPALLNAPSNKLKKGINPSNCFTVDDIGGKYNICLKHPIRGFYDKASLYTSIRTKAQYISLQVKNDERRQNYLNGASPEDPFDFGVIPEYKKFSKEFNTDNLSEDTFEIAKNGMWEGWVYEGTLTERNFKKVFTPVFCKINNGFIEFRTEEAKSAYKVLKLDNYDQVCTSHCKPDEYIKINKKYSSNVDDTMYLEKTVNNYMGQMKYPYINEACVVMDFMSPIYQFGQQHIICAVDKTQGEKIRLAIENLYYTSLLNLNMDTGVRRPNTNTDKYFGRLIINDKLRKDFNSFFIDQYGLIGHLVNEQHLTPTQRITNTNFNITYTQIDNDNFGTTCAFWYKNMNIKQRSNDMLKIITDNNCCFRFFTKKDRQKIEICTFNPDGRVCIKHARELMKGIKQGCIESELSGKQPNNVSPDEKDKAVDVYQKNTLDDHDNGIFEGFAYFGNAINSAQQPRSNPHFIKIGENSIDFFDDHLQKRAKYSVSVNNYVFSCKGQLSCSPKEFLLFAQTHQKYMSVQTQIRTIYNIFQDTYSFNEKDFEENCFVLETMKTPILLCAYMKNQGLMIKNALSNSFKLKFFRVKMSSVPEPPQNKSYKILFRKELAEVKDEVFLTMDGLQSKHTKQNIFDYRNIDNDPVTQERCGIWYKSLKPIQGNPNATPDPLLLKNSCCFKFFATGTQFYICADVPNGICVADAFQLMKAIWNGCRFSNPHQEQMEVSPDSEIIGQLVYKNKIHFDAKKEKYDIHPLERINVIFKHDMIKRKFFIDTYNEISFSRRRSLYQGWVNIYPLNIKKENKFQILKYYARLTPENFSFHETSRADAQAKLIIRPDMLSMVCAKGAACLPNDYINNFLIKYDPKFAFYKQFFKTKFDFYELGKEEGCSVLENFIENEPVYFVICPRFHFHRTMSKSMQALIDKTDANFSKDRIMLSTTYGKILREIIYNAYLTARKFVRGALLFNLKDPVDLAKISLVLKKQEYKKVAVNESGVTSEGQQLLKFDDLQNCLVQYNLVYVPEDMYVFSNKQVYNKSKPQCCMRYSGPVSQEYACFGDLNCEYVTYEFAYKFHSKCVIRRNRPKDDLFNELNAGDNVALKPLIKRLFKEELCVSNPSSLESNPNLGTVDNTIKQKSLLIKYMYELRDILHEVNKVEIKSSRKLNSSPQDTTPADPVIPENTGVTAKYIGQSIKGEWEITAARNRITKYKQGARAIDVFIIGEHQYVKTKEFFAVIAEKGV